jgi:hypothetical protein
MKKVPVQSVLLLGLALVLGILLIQNCEPDKGLYRWKKSGGKQYLLTGGDTIGYLNSQDIHGLKYSDQITPLGDGVFRVSRKIRNTHNKPIDSLRITLDFVHSARASWLMIPSVSYNGNQWGRGLEPKGYQKDGTWWSFSFSRSAIPGATYSEGDRWAVALWGDIDDTKRPFSCSLMPEDSATTHRLIWPEEEMPLRYSNRDQYSPGFRNNLALAPGEEITVSGVLVITQLMPEHEAIKVFLSKAWEIIPHPQQTRPEPDTAWNLATRFVKESLWAEEGVFKGFSIGLWLRDGGWIQRPGWKYEIGWAGQNASISISLLEDYLRNQNSESLEKGLACLDTWAAHAPQPNGLIRTHFDYILGIEKSEEVVDACNLGQAASDFLIAWETAKKCGVERDRYKEIALGICDFMLTDQQPSGQYGKGWKPDGTCLYRDGTVGAFIIPGMLRAYQVTGNKAYLASARRAYDFYFSEFAENGYTSAGALDTWCIDKESSLPVLRSALMLFETTGDSTYLDKAVRTSWYLSTWQWHYSVPMPDTSDFKKYGYDTFGGTAVSTQHHHIDAFGMWLVPEWIKLSKYTGDPIWKDKAMATWINGNLCVADGKTPYHGVIRPAGSQTEAYFQTHWSGRQGSFHDWLVSWMAALRMEVLRNPDNWKELN